MISQVMLGIFLSYVPSSNRAWPEHPILIGHRGAKARAPENTINSFELAMELGASGIEFDVYLSRDKVPFVIHDDELDRTTNRSGMAFELDIKELSQLDAGKEWPGFGPVKIPTLSQTLDAMPDGAYVNIELKGQGVHSREELVDEVLKTIAPSRKRLFIVVSSFDARILECARRKDEELLIGFLLDDRVDHALFALAYLSRIRPDALHLPPSLVSEKIVKMAHAKGLPVFVWTVNDNEKARKLLELGVKGIFCDLPQSFQIDGWSKRLPGR